MSNQWDEEGTKKLEQPATKIIGQIISSLFSHVCIFLEECRAAIQGKRIKNTVIPTTNSLFISRHSGRYLAGIQRFLITKVSSTYVIPEVFNRESGVIWNTTISPIEQFGDDRSSKKRL